MAISRTQFIEMVKRRLGAPVIKVELCDEQIIDHIYYAKNSYLRWAVGNATQEVYFTMLLQPGKRFYTMPEGVVDVIGYDDRSMKSGGINTLFSVDNYLFSNGFFGSMFQGGYDLISYHIVADFMSTLHRYRPSKYNFKYHKATNQVEINPIPSIYDGELKTRSVTLPDPDTGVMTEYYVESPGYVLIHAYMISGSSLPDYKPDWRDILKEKKTIVERRTLVDGDITNKTILLNHMPYINTASDDANSVSNVVITRNGVGTVEYVDWALDDYNNRVVNWTDYAGATDFQSGDELEIIYTVIYESNYYPGDWSDVTATTTEVEQYQLNQRVLDVGYVRLQYPVWSNNIRVTVNGAYGVFNTDFTIDAADPQTLRWSGMNWYGQLQVDDVLTVTYVAMRDKRPSYETRSQSIHRQYTTRIENVSVTNTDVTNKYVTLTDTVSVNDGVILVRNGVERVYSTDYTITTSGATYRLSWNGKALDGVMQNGDKLTITYCSATAFEKEMEEPFYDTPWMLDYVTALSKMTLGLIRRKFASFSSMGNTGISMDGDSLVSEAQQEIEKLDQRLREEECEEGMGIFVGFM